MKRKFIILSACLFATSAFAQIEEAKEVDNIDWQEDTTEIVSIADIMRDEQEVTMRKNVQKHYDDVWSRRSYLNISTTTTTLTPQNKYLTGVDANDGLDKVPEFKSDWGVSLTWGRGYRLHKPSIANVAQFNIDYTWIDLNVNHFKAEGNANLYDSRHKFYPDEKSNDSWLLPGSSDFKKAKFYTPWNLEKYEVNYGMNLGPSLTLSPFTYVNVPALHYIQMNIFFHVGYQASIIYMQNNDEYDANKNPAKGSNEEELKEEMGDHPALDFGHGITTSWGISLSWKFIGVGLENRRSTLKYQSLSESDFGKNKYEFDCSYNRVYLQFKF